MRELLRRRLNAHLPSVAAAYQYFRHERELKRFSARSTPYGFRFAGHGSMQQGAFEPAEVRWLSAALEPADVFVDIGAHVGFYTCLARYSGKRVIAVEPSAQNLSVLYANLQANGWTDVEVFPLALGDHVGTCDLYGASTAASLIPYWAGYSRTLRQTVPLSTLDVLVGCRFPSARILIKVDVEGSEHSLLRGAPLVLGRMPAPDWLVEICLAEHHPNGINPEFAAVFERFWSAGYRCYALDEPLRPVMLADVSRWVHRRARDFGSINYIFTQDERWR